jgi:zinc/manganese transport system ATP-binding protein
VLRFNDVAFAYSGTPVFTDLNLELAGSAITAIVGHNGSGKSTLLELAAGVVEPDRGHVTRPGQIDVAFAPQRSQVTDTFPITVTDAVAMGRWRRLGLLRRQNCQDRAIVDYWIRTMGLQELQRKRLGALSGGQRQRVLLAQAFAQQAGIIALDEPTTGLDADATVVVLHEARRLAGLGATVLIATHDPDLAQACDHRVTLDHGCVQQTRTRLR